jgi:hypothetical protein
MQYLKALHQLALTTLVGGLLVMAGCGGAKGNSTPNLTSQNNGPSTGQRQRHQQNKSNTHTNSNSGSKRNSKSDSSTHGHSQSHGYTNPSANAWNNQFRR